MKKCISIILLLILSTGLSHGEDSIIDKFLKALHEKKTIQYTCRFSFSDEAKGTSVTIADCAFKLMPDDTIAGAWYNISNEGSTIYNGSEILSHNSSIWGDSTVHVLLRSRHPEEFSDQVIEMHGQKFIAPSRVRSSFFYSYSPVALAREINDVIKYPVTILSDTTIEGIECTRVRFTVKDTIVDGVRNESFHQLAFDKQTFMPMHIMTHIPEQQLESFISGYVFNKADDKLFTREFFPEYYRFEENPKHAESKHLSVGERVPEFDLPSLSGRNISLKSLAGKPAFIVFSEIGCVPCMLSIPSIHEIMKEFPDLQIVAIYPRDKKEALQKLVKSKNIKFDILYSSKETGKDYYVSGYPDFFLVDKHGILRYTHSGYGEGSKKYWVQEINKLLKDDSGNVK